MKRMYISCALRRKEAQNHFATVLFLAMANSSYGEATALSYVLQIEMLATKQRV